MHFLPQAKTTKVVIQEGGVEYIMKAMSTHISEAGVQEMACGALATLSINGKTNHQGGTSAFLAFWILQPADEYRAMVCDQGAIKMIIMAMWNHSSNQSLQERACGALCMLAVDRKFQLEH